MAGNVKAHGGADAHGFLERDLEVGELLRFRVRDDVGEAALFVCGVDLGTDLVVDGWGF